MRKTSKPRTAHLARVLTVAALTALFISAGFSAAEARRLALVVGNAEYTTVPKLKNAARDAQDMAAALERLGFEVTLLTDVRAADFWAAVEAFSVEAETAEGSVFYYAGHAFQMNGVNYLVPVDAALQSREAIRAETWNLDGIIARLQDRQRQTLVFLDACRNDPVPQSVRGSGAADGLARMQTGVGTFVAFATEPGAVTYDGAGDAPNSPFATALLKHIETPGLSISDMMIKVRNEVSEITGGRQTPWDQSSLREQFYFQAETAAKQELSEADYELLAQLSPEDRAKFLDLLRESGFDENSLQQADDAITVASFNLEVAAEASVIIGAAPVVDGTAAVVEVPEFDMSSLEVIDTDVTIGDGTDAATDVVPDATTATDLPEGSFDIATAPTETPGETAITDGGTPATDPVAEVAPDQPPVEAPPAEAPGVEIATETPAVEAPPVEAPEVEVATETPAVETPPVEAPEVEVATETPAVEAPPVEAPEVDVATETPAVETPVETDIATDAPATAPDAPVETAETAVATETGPAADATTEVATAVDPVEPATAEALPPESVEVATAPVETAPPLVVTDVAPDEATVALLPTFAAPLALGTTETGPPIRLAALTWQTRGIVELNAVSGNRTRLPANEVMPDTEANRAFLAAIDPSLLDDTLNAIDPANLKLDTQAELRRLGCYRMTVDGDWGRGSRTALTSYFLAKRQVPDTLEPTVELLEQLRRETQVVCQVQVARAKVVPGKTKAILPQKAAAQGNTVKVKASAGRKAVTVEKAKTNIKKNLSIGFN